VKLIFAKSIWEVDGLVSLPEFLDRVASDGFDASELYLPSRKESVPQIIASHKEAGLRLIGQISTDGCSPSEHVETLRQRYALAVECGAIAVNSHTGSDLFTFEENRSIFEAGIALEQEYGIPLWHETHRRRALFSAPASETFIRSLDQLSITADFSHWFCVHESDLRDQEQRIQLAIEATGHIHARVGFAEGPQVSDPRNPFFSPWLERHMELWKRVLESRASRGFSSTTVTPEFGPAPYMPMSGIVESPVADAWEINSWMKEYLSGKFGD